VTVGKSFAQIFCRNALNVGITAIECLEAAEAVKREEVELIGRSEQLCQKKTSMKDLGR
jgi:3-isopropylmalate dehydratase small subunit